jgi:hypothetical protein
MPKYNIISDFEKQQKLKVIEQECLRLNKPRYWILKQLGIPRSTYYDWKKTGGKTKSKAPKVVWNKTSERVESIIIGIRDDITKYRSQRSGQGISSQLEVMDIFITPSGVKNVLVRFGKSNELIRIKKTFIIYPRSTEFLGVVCIDDVSLSNKKPRDYAVFNAIDEYSQESVAISFVDHRINRYDVIELLEKIKEEYGKYPKILRFDNARAHLSLLVKQFCEDNNIIIQPIDKGVPQQNWPVESFNGVIKKDLLTSSLWIWDNLDDKQDLLERYREYYNCEKRLRSDYLNRTPREISTAITSINTQKRLQYRLLRKHYGQVIAKQAILDNMAILTA